MNNVSSKQAHMSKLSEEIMACKKCSLWKTRNLPLIGDGSLDAKVLMIGEAPGRQEDLQGKAFIGNAGKILDQLLEHVGLSRQQIYFTNILKCHPPKNRPPSPSEVQACVGYLFSQIKVIQPEIIITLGKFASQQMFNKVSLPFTRISDIHGKCFTIRASYGPVKIIPQFHPSTACYNPSLLDTLKNDFAKTIGTLSGGHDEQLS